MKHNNFHHAVLGGTFDHLHAGHRKLLTAAFANASQVTIGLSLPVLYQHKSFASHIQSYAQREQALKTYLQQNGLLQKSVIIPLHDIFGTTLTDTDIEAIFVTERTKQHAVLINDTRKAKSLEPLTIVTVPFARGDDKEIVSSERIRAGEIDREGRSYLRFFLQKDRYTLTPSLRETVKKPAGKVIQNETALVQFLSGVDTITCVGDVVSATLLRHQLSPALCVIDLKTQRHDVNTAIASFFPTKPASFHNPAGTITSGAAQYFLKAFSDYYQTRKTQYIVVSGEEDLLVLPAVLFAPLDSVILYGQPHVGIVAITVTEEAKEQYKIYLSQCTS